MSDPRPAPVYAGVDGSANAWPAIDLAAAEALARGADLVLLHVADGPGHHSGVLAPAEAAARLRHPTVVVTSRCLAGDPATVLADASRDASLLVVGHRGHCGSRSGAGSVAEAVVALATVPVVVHRPMGSAPEPRPVLAGLAPHRVDDAVLEFAFAAASRRRAPLHILSVWTDFSTLDPARDTRTAPGDEAVGAAAIRRWSDAYPDVTVEVVTRHGLDATIALAAASHAAQLVVIGAGSGATVALAGSLAHALVHRSACPVAIVHRPHEMVDTREALDAIAA